VKENVRLSLDGGLDNGKTIDSLGDEKVPLSKRIIMKEDIKTSLDDDIHQFMVDVDISLGNRCLVENLLEELTKCDGRVWLIQTAGSVDMVPYKLSSKGRGWWKICMGQIIATQGSGGASMVMREKPSHHIAILVLDAATEAVDGSLGGCLMLSSIKSGFMRKTRPKSGTPSRAL